MSPESPHQTAPEGSSPNRFCRSPEDFEDVAAEWMRFWGFRDARRTAKGPDAGIDVESSAAVAQVKAWMTPIGRPEIQQLRGVAYDSRYPIFFSLMAYTIEAQRFADEAGVALFRFTGYNGQIEAVNARAKLLISNAPTQIEPNFSNETSTQIRSQIEEMINTPGMTLILHIADSKNLYVQFLSESARVYGEAVSNAFLEGIEELSSVDHERMLHLGWTAPADTNYHRSWERPLTLQSITEPVIKTFETVYRVGTRPIRTEKFVDAPEPSMPATQPKKKWFGIW